MPLINTTEIGRRRKLTALIAAFSVAAWILSASAHADPDPDPNAPVGDPRALCESPDVSGVFHTATASDPPTHSECQYIVEGSFYYDNYDNGAYTGTLVYRDGAKVPTERPDIPPLYTIPGKIPLTILGGA